MAIKNNCFVADRIFPNGYYIVLENPIGCKPVKKQHIYSKRGVYMKFTSNTWKRVYRTFLQAFFGALTGTVALIDFTDKDSIIKSVLFVVLVPSVASGLSAIMNLEGANGNDE